MAKLRPTVLPEPVLAPADISENTLNATAPMMLMEAEQCSGKLVLWM